MQRICKQIAAPLLLLLLLTACTDTDLVTVSKALVETSHAIGVFQTVVIDAEKKGFVSEDIAHELILIGVQVNNAGFEAVEVTRGINSLSQTDRTNLLKILTPVIATLSNADSTLVRTITDPQAQNTVRTALAVIQTTLSTAQIALATR